VAVVKTYLVKTGEDWRDVVVVVWTLVLTVKTGEDWRRLEKIRGDWRGLLWRWTVVDCWLREIDYETESPRHRVTEESSVRISNFGFSI
jgi:hypothetical protein